MKLASCEYAGATHVALVEASWDVLAQGKVLLLSRQPLWPDTNLTLQQCIEQNDRLLPLIRQIDSLARNTDWLSISDVKLLAPIINPKRNIICLGWNYIEHHKESASAKGLPLDEPPRHPVVFTKATTTINGPFGDIHYDAGVSTRLDWEVELGVIIGKAGRHIAPSSALQHIFGYTVINDISARDLQKRHQQFFLGKSMDGSCPMGPWIVTADEIANPQCLALSCKVNNVIKQNATTAQQIFGVADIIATLSKVMTLLPGDIIATGTPSGVGFARTPPEYLRPGDVVECQIEGIGSIRNTVVE